MRIIILKIIFSVFIPGLLFGQPDTTERSHKRPEDRAHPILSGGVSYQRQITGEIGVIYGYASPTGPCNPSALGGIKLSSEFSFNSSNFFIGPKLSAEINFFLLGARLNIVDYTDFAFHDFKFTPEIGFSLSSILNLFYGYNISLSENRIAGIGKHKISLLINYDKLLWGI